jgi:hypothetical protein
VKVCATNCGVLEKHDKRNRRKKTDNKKVFFLCVFFCGIGVGVSGYVSFGGKKCSSLTHRIHCFVFTAHVLLFVFGALPAALLVSQKYARILLLSKDCRGSCS